MTNNKTKIGMTYRKLSPANKRAVIASRRKKGDLVKVSTELDYSESHVCNVLHGRAENKTILNYTYNMVRGRKKK